VLAEKCGMLANNALAKIEHDLTVIKRLIGVQIFLNLVVLVML
jgi:hypothetical protein